MTARPPVVGIVCDRRVRRDHIWQAAAEEYASAVREGANALPLLIPAFDEPLSADDVCRSVDGLLFTGSVSNVAPELYGGHARRDESLADTARDAIAIPLLREASARGIPMLCICRGFQEANVAFGGTLHQHIQEVPGFADHRAPRDAPDAIAYAEKHDVTVIPGGIFDALLSTHRIAERRFAVNSLHEQGIDRLAPGLRVEARAPDGVIEAVSLTEPAGFFFAVQWHPEWAMKTNPVSRALFAAFGEALRAGKKS